MSVCIYCTGKATVSLVWLFRQLFKINNLHLISDGNTKNSKRRWTKEEVQIFDRIVGPYIEESTMPPRHILDRVAEKVAHSRTINQIRTRANNVILGKQTL